MIYIYVFPKYLNFGRLMFYQLEGNNPKGSNRKKRVFLSGIVQKPHWYSWGKFTGVKGYPKSISELWD